ncbi:MAG: VOC family protein [Pseudomonadota bacterium]
MPLPKAHHQSIQCPVTPGDIFFDNIVHFTPDMDHGAQEFERAGFTLTPWGTYHSQHGASGTGNRCVMLREGYLGLVTTTGETTAVSQQVASALARYAGPHMLSFTTPALEAKAKALKEAGFRVLPMLDLKRKVSADDGGETELRFSVLRPAPGQMPEGRFQYVTHHTPDALWQERFTNHENGAVKLISAIVTVEDVPKAANRYRCFFGREPMSLGSFRASEVARFELERGAVTITNPAWGYAGTGNRPVPALPCVPAYTLGFANLGETAALWAQRGFDVALAACGGLAIQCAGASIIGYQA